MEFHDRYFGGDAMRCREARFYTPHVNRTLSQCARSQLRDVRGKRVLYYGCGVTSDVLVDFARAGATVVAIDISGVALRQVQGVVRASGLTERAHTAQMDGELLGFRDGAFDLIYGRAILHHLDVARCGRELARVLAPGGRAVFIEPLGSNPLVRLYRALTPKSRTPDEHPFVGEDLRELSRHFRSLRQRPFFLLALGSFVFSGFWRNAALYDVTYRALNGLDTFLIRTLPPLGRYCWATVLTLEK
jgi:SAM-dependent methyltransferase